MKLQLFLEDEEIELDKDVQFTMNKTYEDLANPANIIVDYSKSVTIPFSKHNCKVLGHIYRLDKLIAPGPVNIGTNIDPAKRIPMKLIYNNQVVLDGYAKFVSSNVNSKTPVFTINIFGKLGEIFNKLKSVKVNKNQLTEEQKAEDDHGAKYILEDCIPDSTILNAAYVYNSWINDSTNTKDPFTENIAPWNIIGFAPAYRGEYNNFEKDKIQISNTDTISTEDYLKNYFFKKLSDIGGEAYANNMIAAYNPQSFAEKLTRDYQFDEFRSYAMKPYIYFNKLYYMFKHKCKQLTGYDMIIDNDWAQDNNPYWSRLCYMLDFLENKNTDKNTEQVPLLPDFTGWSTKYIDNDRDPYTQILEAQNITQANIDDENLVILPFIIDITAVCRDYPNIPLNGLIPTMYTVPNDTSGIIKFKFDFYDVYDYRDHYVSTAYAWDGKSATGNYTPANKVKHDRFLVTPYTENNIRNIKKAHDYYYIPKIIIKTGYRFKGKLRMKVTCEMVCPITSHTHRGLYTVDPNKEWTPPIYNEDFTINIRPTSYETRINYTNVNLKNLYYSDKPLFDVLLQYTKMYGLVWEISNDEKKIYIRKRNKIFKNYNITQWDDKLDKSKDFNIEPVVFQVDRINFNYETLDGNRYTEYKDKYNTEYGSKSIKTTYGFKTEDLNMFEEITPSCCSSETYLTIYSVKGWLPEHTVNTVPDDKVLINAEDTDKTKAITAYNWYFRNYNHEAPAPVYLITDDTPEMIKNNKSCWIDRNYASTLPTTKVSSVIPRMHIAADTPGQIYGCVFNCPNEDYTYDKSIAPILNNSIYDRIWKDYINERYNAQNKKITCYVYITPEEYANFKFNNFVSIGEQLFMVNKIFDYNISEFTPTKVELIQITNIHSYTE